LGMVILKLFKFRLIIDGGCSLDFPSRFLLYITGGGGATFSVLLPVCDRSKSSSSIVASFLLAYLPSTATVTMVHIAQSTKISVETILVASERLGSIMELRIPEAVVPAKMYPTK